MAEVPAELGVTAETSALLVLVQDACAAWNGPGFHQAAVNQAPAANHPPRAGGP